MSRFNSLLVLVAIVLGIVLLPLLHAYLNAEAYCFIYPSIETKFAPGFSEKKFRQISLGMRSNEVQAILGEPIGIIHQDGLENWGYSTEKSLWWADFAWLRRDIIISNGIVISIDDSVAYD